LTPADPEKKSPIISPDFESDATTRFRLGIVRESPDNQGVIAEPPKSRLRPDYIVSPKNQRQTGNRLWKKGVRVKHLATREW